MYRGEGVRFIVDLKFKEDEDTFIIYCRFGIGREILKTVFAFFVDIVKH